MPATGAGALAVGIVVDFTGVGDCLVRDAVGVAALVGGAAGWVAVGVAGGELAVGGAWLSAGVVV